MVGTGIETNSDSTQYTKITHQLLFVAYVVQFIADSKLSDSMLLTAHNLATYGITATLLNGSKVSLRACAMT